ncbi:MAG: hypothetical protein O2856_05370 [Planctomycetota bacterium]|nr:hypothetical protein [Planctomycetota bacterium]
MSSTRILVLLILQATLFGCQTTGRSVVVRHVEPILPKTMSCTQLIDHLNAQNRGLDSWKCMTTEVHVKTPMLPIPANLKGSLSCSAPNRFRLMAENFVANADFGSNKDICWAYSKPGPPIVTTWKHEDSHLLEYVEGDFPRLDSEWLMVILGVQPLDERDFQIQKPPAGSRELWLVAIEESASGHPLRRVIKVDTDRGFVREHALIDHNGEHLLRAQLSNHRRYGGHVLPHTVKISFPPQKTELTLNFKTIERNCAIPDGLWTPPGGDRLARVDLGDDVRRMYGNIPPRRKRPDAPRVELLRDDSMFDGAPQRNVKELIEPDFDTDPMSDETLFSDTRPSDGRFFHDDGLYQSNESFGGRPKPNLRDPEFDSRDPFQETRFLEEPDFDTVAPAKTKPRWFGIQGRR